MANDAAWQSGVDIATGRKGKKKNGDSTADDTGSSKPTGGLLGLASKGIQKLRGKKQASGGGADLAAAQLTDNMPAASFLPGTLIPTAKHGGRVKRSGIVHVHAGETIVPAKHWFPKKASHKRAVTKR